MIRNDAVINTRLLTGQCEIDVVISRDFIHQRILKGRQTVAEADSDVAPYLPVRQFEDTIRRLCWMCCWKLREPIVDICERFGGQNPVDLSQTPFMDWQQFSSPLIP